jgi:hypothetical protein
MDDRARSHCSSVIREIKKIKEKEKFQKIKKLTRRLLDLARRPIMPTAPDRRAIIVL